jgi:hypothetical protein
MTPTACGMTQSSSWHSIICRTEPHSAHSQPSRGSRTCRDRGRCCAWPGPWSGCTAPASGRCRGASSWTWMIPSMPSMVGSSFGSSTPTTTSTASSLSWCSTARAGLWPPCCARPAGRVAPRPVPSCADWCARSAATGPGVEILIRADSHYCAPEVLDFCRAQRLAVRSSAANPGRGLYHHAAPPCPGTRAEHHGPLCRSRQCRQAASLHRVLRRRRQLEPGRAHDRPCRSSALRWTARMAWTRALSSPT